jgi:hypothetical protein
LRPARFGLPHARSVLLDTRSTETKFAKRPVASFVLAATK